MIQLLSLELCETESVLRTFKVLNIILTLIKIIVPILIIILGMVDFSKVVLSGKDDEFKKSFTTVVKRIIAGLIVFMIPTFLNFIFDLNNYHKDIVTEFAGCESCLTNGKECDTLIEIAKVKDQERREEDAAKYAITEAEFKAWQEKVSRNNPELQRQNREGRQQTAENTPTVDYSQHTVAKGKYFDSTDVTKISGLSEEEFINVLQNSKAYKGKAKVYLPYAKDLILAEKNHGVNAFYLIGLYSYESGWLGSKLTKECNNIGGVRFYNQTYGNGKKATNCWSRYAGFDSISEFIDFHANLLEKKYLTPTGSHYHGTGVADVAKDYGSGHGIDTIIQIANYVSTK